MLTRTHAIVHKFTKRYFQMPLACNMTLYKLVCRNITQVLQRLIQLIQLTLKKKIKLQSVCARCLEAEVHANHWNICVLISFFIL